jgi:hypothetical protein
VREGALKYLYRRYFTDIEHFASVLIDVVRREQEASAERAQWAVAAAGKNSTTAMLALSQCATPRQLMGLF